MESVQLFIEKKIENTGTKIKRPTSTQSSALTKGYDPLVSEDDTE